MPRRTQVARHVEMPFRHARSVEDEHALRRQLPSRAQTSAASV